MKKIKSLVMGSILAFCLLGAHTVHSQIYQQTYSSGIDRDHYSVVVSQSNSAHHVLAGTEENGPGNTQLHVMEVDANGLPIWEKRYQNINDEQVFDIAVRNGGYVLTGFANNGSRDEILVMLLDLTGNIVVQQTYEPLLTGMESYGVHVIETVGDPGYLITGFALSGQATTDQKRGIVLKVDGSLSIQWMISMNSPQTNNDDWDMNSHGLEIPGQGYFISGSANGNGAFGTAYQEAQATMLDYSGSMVWQKNYATDHNTNGHRYVSESAIYDPGTNEIFQLGNTSWSHSFFIKVMDATTGTTDVSKEIFFSSGIGNNIQGFEIIESNNPGNYCIAGIHRNHNWISEDKATLGQNLSGSPAFMLELEKATQNIVWQNQYNIPSAGYFTPNDIFAAFTGQQPIIYTPNMVVAKANGQGYILSSVRKEPGNPVFDLELLDLNNQGANICTSENPQFVTVPVFMHEETNTVFNALSPFSSTGVLTESIMNSNVTSCGTNQPPCQVNALFTYTINACDISLQDASTGTNVSCWEWDMGDGTVYTGVTAPTHTYASSGTYEICLTVCCKADDGNLTYDTYCEFVTIVCPQSGCGCDVNNLLVDGDFEGGGGATYPGLPVNCTCAGGTVCVGAEPRDKCLNGLWIDDLWDNTLGTPAGHFLIIDGANGIVWRETAPIVSGQQYIFSFWNVREISDMPGNNSTQTFNLMVDGVVVGTVMTAAAPPQTWTQYCIDFTATTTNPSANIDIVQVNGTGFNDYGIDDIEFGQCETPCTVPIVPDFFNYGVSADNCYKYGFTSNILNPANNLCYEWSVNGVVFSTLQNPTYIFPANGTYLVCLTVYCCNNPATSQDYCETIVVDCCEVPILNDYFSYSINADCFTHNFTALTTSSSGLCYEWSINGVLVSTASTFSYTFPANGSYKVCLKVFCCNNPSVSKTYCEKVIVNCCTVPILNDYFQYTNTAADCFTYNFVVSVPSTSTNLCYRWFIDGTFVSSSPSFTHTFPTDGTYQVCLEVFCCNNPSQIITYCEDVVVDCIISGCGCNVNNLLVDGDFEGGGGATYPGLPVNCTCAGGTVCVGAEPRDKCVNGLWIDDLWDNTLGTPAGHFLIIDGGNGIVWRETAPVVSGQPYIFSFWNVREISDMPGNNSTQTFNLMVDGVVVGTVMTAAAPPQTWTQYCVEFTATTTNPSANIDIVQVNGTGFNDYGIDDIEFGQCQAPCVIPSVADFFDYTVTSDNCFEYIFTNNVMSTGVDLCYEWSVDGVVFSTLANPTYIFPANGSYEVCLRVFCCDDPTISQDYCEKIVVDCCEVPILNDYFSYAVNADCFTHTFTALPPASSGLCYEWYINSVLVSTASTFSYTFPANGSYKVCLKVFCCNNPSVSKTYCEKVIVNCCTIPVLSDYFLYTNSPVNCFSYNFAVSIPGVNPNLCFKWYIDGTFVSSSSTFAHIFPADGTYEVCLVVFCCNNPSQAITYCEDVIVDCIPNTGCGCEVINQVQNGDFEQGFPVNSGLPILCTCSTGSVCVVTEPRDKCPNGLWLDDFWDHTLGTPNGHFLMVDGANGVIWTQNTPVVAGQDYVFSFWQVRELSDNATNNSTQTFNLVVGTTVIGTFATAGAGNTVWTEYCAEYTAPISAVGMPIQIVQTAGTGFNDYGIDDIEFGICDPNQAFQGNGGVGSAEKMVTVEDEVHDFELYPNPATDQITIAWTSPASASELNIYSAEGQLVKTIDLNEESEMTIQIGEFAPGIYVIRAGETTKRFVITSK